MFKRIKHLNKLCIAIIFSALALALAIGLVAISVLKNQEFDDPLKGFVGEYEVDVKQPLVPPVSSDSESESESESESQGGGDESGGGDEENTDYMMYRVSSENAGTLYLRTGSYGNYKNNAWEAAVPYVDLIEDKYPASFLTVRQLEESVDSMKYKAVTIIAQNSIQILPQYMSTQHSVTSDTQYQPWIPANDVDPSGIRSGAYGLCTYNIDCNNVLLNSFETLPQYEEYESAYRSFVYENYLEIDPELESYLLSIAEAQNFNPADPEIIIKITDYLYENTEYNEEKADALDAEENVIYSFLEDYKQGVCRHYAATATMMLRALGIPARYTYGYMVRVDGENFSEVNKNDAHAWVEVYVDGLGWKMAEVTKVMQAPPEDEDDEEDNDLPTFKIKPVAVEKLYDGTSLAAKDEIVFLKGEGLDNFTNYANMGYTFEVDVSGITADPGKSPSLIDSFTIYDPNGVVVYSNTDGSVENQFNVIFEEGEMHLYLGIIQLYSGDRLGIEYTGQGVSMPIDSDCGYTLVEGVMEYGHNLVMEEITDNLPVDAKMHPNRYAFKMISDSYGGIDVTSWYKYEYDFGKIEIVRREVRIITGSDTWDYDNWNGEDVLTCGDFSCSGLLEGHEISFTIIGEQKTGGTSENTIDWESIVVVDEEGNDVTENYTFSVIYGTLSII